MKIRRFTKDNDTQFDFVGRCSTNIEEFSTNKELRNGVLKKLGEIENIEEEFEIDLIILLKALKYGIYIKDGYNGFKANGDKWFITSIENEIAYYHKQLNVKQFRKRKVGGMFGEDEYCPPEEVDKAVGAWNSTCVYIEDYGKTWALTKEELENDKRED